MKNPEAFPAGAISAAGDLHWQEGMTLRDYFAAAAMQSALRNFSGSPQLLGDNIEGKLAELSYGMADAMLREREKAQ